MKKRLTPPPEAPPLCVTLYTHQHWHIPPWVEVCLGDRPMGYAGACLLLALISFGVYSNSLYGEWVFDDIVAVCLSHRRPNTQ